MNKPNIIFWDLETLPNLAEVMKRLPSMGQWPGRTLKADINSIICFGYKRLGEKKANCVSVWDFNYTDINDDSAIVHYAYEVLKDADAIVTHNGKKFDSKVLNTRLLHWGLPTLPKIKHIDTKVVAKRLMLYSNRLGDVSNFLGGEDKLAHTGWKLWVDVQNGDKKAMKLMADYCKQDVEVLHQVYTGLRPLMKESEVPNHNYFKDGAVCGTCGSQSLQKNGVRQSRTGLVQRYLCYDCGSSMSKKINSNAKLSVEGV